MKAVTHLEKVIAGEASAVTHLEKVIAQETSAVTYTEKVITGEAAPVTHLQKVIAGETRPVTHLEYVWAGGSPPSVQEYTGAVPVTFVADGTPLIDLLISGNEEHSGTPTPDNPIMPQGTGERTGNLFDFPVYRKDRNSPNTKIYSTYLPKNTYVLSCEVLCHEGAGFGSAGAMYVTYDGTKRYIIPNSSSTDNFAKYSTTFTGEITEVGFVGYNYDAGNPNSYVIIKNIQLNSGSTALPYEPYGYKIPISSANTTTPVYLGEVQTTRKIKKLVLTGEENITSGHLEQNLFNIPISDYLRAPIVSLTCTHYTAQQNVDAWGRVSNEKACFYIGATVEFKQLYIRDSSYSTIDDFKSYLAAQYAAGTPVTVWYVLATEQTGIVNEPLMKIGDYADTLSMEQASVPIPTANGSTTLDVETTVKPSEVYIKYRGEAVATLSALQAEVSSPEATEEVNPEEMEETENGSEDISLQHKPEAVE